ncbi:hypothetical protein HDU79_002990 [Rhizoclosmatium sp. JEL0117]|nr:hypothetical protein HDU79_002990 [Rhizoclosmatium sp. JEL0117]
MSLGAAQYGPKFFGFNTPNLHLIEDTVPWVTPTSFEVNDGLVSVLQAGSSVTRIYTLAIGPSRDTVHITNNPANSAFSWKPIAGTSNPTLFANEELFVALDNVLAAAGNLGVQIIVPLIDQWDWWGGVPAFASMHQVTTDEFYTDSHTSANFFAVVEYVAKRNNTVSGIQYRNDSAIFAWETGNELSMGGGRVPAQWTTSLTKLLKNVLNVKQYVIDGSYSLYGWDTEVLNEPSIDGFTGHYYQLPAKFLIASSISNSVSPAGTIIFFILSALCFILSIVFCIKPSLFRIKSDGKNLCALLGSVKGPSNQGKFDMALVSAKKRAIAICSLLVFGFIAFFALASVFIWLGLFRVKYADRFNVDHDLIVKQYKKLFYVGEFGLSSLSDYQNLLAAVNASQALGALVWSLRFHSRNGGFWNHDEGGGVQSFHLPGFAVNRTTAVGIASTGFGDDELAVVDLMKSYAAGNGASKSSQYYQKPPVGDPILFPPNVTKSIINGEAVAFVSLTWRGSTGARSYIIERAVSDPSIIEIPSNETNFAVVYSGVVDAVAGGQTMLVDQVRAVPFSYRVRGLNEYGYGPYSSVVTAF